jgi:hypothetical protein
MAARKTNRRTQTQPTQSHGPRIRKPIVAIINELKSWLPNYANGKDNYPDTLFRILAALPGGEELENVGYEPLNGFGWHEANQLGRVLVAIQDKQDVEDIARELLSDNQEELEEGPRGVREDSPPPFQPSARESRRIGVRDRVEAGRSGTDDHDTGVVLAIRGRTATVAWDSGVRTDIDVGQLRPTTERHSGGQRFNEGSRHRRMTPVRRRGR